MRRVSKDAHPSCSPSCQFLRSLEAHSAVAHHVLIAGNGLHLILDQSQTGRNPMPADMAVRSRDAYQSSAPAPDSSARNDRAAQAVPRGSNLGRSGQRADRRRPAVTDLVLDASVAISWCFNNEATAAGDRVLERLAAEAASVPAVWHLEIANVLALSERRGRNLSRWWRPWLLWSMKRPRDAPSAVCLISRAERLTAYDAVYLELAMRLGIPLASKDADLVRHRRAPRRQCAQGHLNCSAAARRNRRAEQRSAFRRSPSGHHHTTNYNRDCCRWRRSEETADRSVVDGDFGVGGMRCAFPPYAAALRSGEAGDYRGEGLEVRLLYSVVGDSPALPPPQSFFNHLLDGPD
jgi:predicted nucleic acid-binding protein